MTFTTRESIILIGAVGVGVAALYGYLRASEYQPTERMHTIVGLDHLHNTSDDIADSSGRPGREPSP